MKQPRLNLKTASIKGAYESEQTGRKCQFCHSKLETRKKHILFCDTCRTHNETYHYAEWLPEMTVAI